MSRRPHAVMLSHAAGVLYFAAVLMLSACAALGSKDLTRDRAHKLIEADKNFSQPYTIRLEGSDKFLVPAESANEQPPDARAAELFYQDYPLTEILHRLGLVEVKATAKKRPEVLAYTGYVTAWEYEIESRMTGKGEEWAEGARDGLPLYRREVTEVTGVTAGQSNHARAEFRWKRVPTRLGEALDLEGATFRDLPAELQQRLKKSISRYGNAQPTSYEGVQSGQAEFQLYDDGWRLESVRL